MWRDDAYLLDILIAARHILEFTQGVDREEFEQNRRLQLAIEKLLENIGEAARNVSQETKDAHPEIPWQAMIGMRNRLVHAYFRIDLTRVWETVGDDIPILISLIEPLVSGDNE